MDRLVHHLVEPLRSFSTSELETAWNGFPPEVVDYICRSKSTLLRCQRTQAYLMLLELMRRTQKLKSHLPVYKVIDGGKPRLDFSVEHDYYFVRFSISHCQKAVAVAVADDIEVGIDVESRRKVSPDLIQRVCTSDELATIAESNDPEMTFLQQWTRKEASLKVGGEGIKGFDSMKNAEKFDFNLVYNLHTGIADVVGAIAWENRRSRDAATVEKMALGLL